MKIFAISDLHLSSAQPKPMDIFGDIWDNYIESIIKDWNACVSEEDIVLLAGDLSWAMNLVNAIPDLNTIGALKGHKVILRGNHDYWWKSIGAVRESLPHKMYAVQNDCIQIGDVLICGSRGWTTPENKNFTPEDQKIYDREVIRLKLSLDGMQKMRKEDSRVIVMMHYPPFNSRFDASPFTELIEQFKPKAVVYGHLHGKNCRCEKKVMLNDVPYYLTSCDQVDNLLVEIDA